MSKIVVLKQFLSPKRAAILKRWLKLILDTYPNDSSRFLKQEKDSPLINPARYTISRETEALCDKPLSGVDPENSLPPPITSSESGQSRVFPRQVIAFVFLLKKPKERIFKLLAKLEGSRNNPMNILYSLLTILHRVTHYGEEEIAV